MNIGKATRNDANILRRRLLKIEAAIKMTVIMAGRRRSPLAEANANIAKIIAGIDDDFISLPPLTESRQERLGRLFSERARVLNEMFLATPTEIERFEKVNALLYDLTQRLYTHAGALYRKTIVGYDREFTDDMEFEGELHLFVQREKIQIVVGRRRILRFGFRLHAQYSRSVRRRLQKTRYGKLEETIRSRGPAGHDGQGAAHRRLSGRRRAMDRISAASSCIAKHSCLLCHARFLFAPRLLHPRSTASERFLGGDPCDLPTIRRPARSVRTRMVG